MATTKTTASEAVKKSAKPTVKPTVKKTAHGLTLTAIGTLDAFGQRFLLRGIQYHEGKGNVVVMPDGYKLTPEGVKAFSARPGLDAAKDRQQKGGKSEQGTAYTKAPASFPVPYVFPFGQREEGTRDSQAAFAALLLAACGK